MYSFCEVAQTQHTRIFTFTKRDTSNDLDCNHNGLMYTVELHLTDHICVLHSAYSRVLKNQTRPNQKYVADAIVSIEFSYHSAGTFNFNTERKGHGSQCRLGRSRGIADRIDKCVGLSVTG